MIASRTDFVAGLPSRAAAVLCKQLPVRIAKMAFPMPSLKVSLAWHERTDADAGARFFRQVVVDAVRMKEQASREASPARGTSPASARTRPELRHRR